MKIFFLATMLSKRASNLINANDEYLVLSPLDDEELKSKCQSKIIKYEIDTLAFVLMMICVKTFLENEFFSDADIGYLSGESNVGEEEIEQILEFLTQAKRLIIAPEIFNETNAKSLEFMLGLICKHFELESVDLAGQGVSFDGKLGELEDGRDFNGACVFYYTNPQSKLLGSELFAKVAKLKNGDTITLKTSFGEFETTFSVDEKLKGLIGIFSHPKAKNCFERLKF